MKKLFYIVSALIIYGSLYPFDFSTSELDDALSNFLNKSLFTSVADILGNVLLFIPLGIAGIITFDKHPIAQRLLLIIFISVLMAFLVQIAQFFIPGRDAALSDVIWNALGTIIGISIAFFSSQHPFLTKRQVPFKITTPLLLIGLWLFWQLLPFIPSLDLYYIKESVKSLWFQHQLSIPETLYISSTILLLGQLLTISLAGKNIIKWLLILAILTLLGKVVIVTQILNLSTIAGIFLGLSIWIILQSITADRRNIIIFLCLILSYTLISLAPYNFSSSPSSFNFIPFAGLLDGSMLTNTSALSEKLFAYAGILWLSYVITGRITRWAIALAFWVTLLEIIQIFLPGRVASISEPIWVLLSAWLLKTMLKKEHHRKIRPASSNTSKHILDKKHPKDNHFLIDFYWLHSWKINLILVCLAIASMLNIVLHIPGIPYNVKELFYNGGTFTSLLTFSFTLLWFGIASGWLAQSIAHKSIPIFTIPFYTIAIGLISYFLLKNSVTHESISDIVGSSNLYRQVVEQQIWGNWAKTLFENLNLSDLAATMERGFRYIALISPIIIFLMLSVQITNRALKVSSKQILINTAISIPWLILCKMIVFDWASTDNLRELIALPGISGISGEFFLYILLLLMCLNTALLSICSTKKILFTINILLTIIAIPIGWFLLNQGLENDIIKYKTVFSGVQFLLGPDRNHLLTQNELFFRWSLVYIGFIFILISGLKFASPSYQWLKNLSYFETKSAVQTLISSKSFKKTKVAYLLLPVIAILMAVGILSLFTNNRLETDSDYQLPEIVDLPEVYLPQFKQQHPRLPAPSEEEIQILLTQNKQFFKQHKNHAKRGKLYSQILIAYSFPGEIDLNKLYKNLMKLKFSGRGNVETKPIALAYDWLYNQWSPEQRLHLKAKVKQACDYQINIIRNEMKLSPYNVFLYNSPLQALIAASLVLHKDIPESEDNCMRFTHDYWSNRVVPVWQQVMGQNGGWHEGGEYIGIGIGQAIYQVPAMWRNATGEDYFRKIPGITGFLDFLVYRTRPDGTHFRWGDAAHFNNAVPDRLPLAIEFQHSAAFNLKPEKRLKPTSWPWGPLTNNKLIKDQTNYKLPLTKLFDGLGLLVSRTSWDDDATYVTFKAGDNYWSHSHLDQGAFTIFKGGALAIDSGLYGPKYGSDHHMNYTYQSIAHNIVTVTDPDDNLPMPAKKKKDKSTDKKKARKIANDGGQRRVGSGWGKAAPLDFRDWMNQSDTYHTATIEKIIEQDDVVVVIADLTPAYTNTLSGEDTFAHRTKRIKRYQRVFVHDKINDVILIFDKINAYKANFRKKWLLHSLLEPTIKKQYFQINTPENHTRNIKGGTLKGKILLPEKFLVNKIGGKGFEFYVDGKNYDEKGTVIKAAKRKKSSEPGEWRLELEPLHRSKRNLFSRGDASLSP